MNKPFILGLITVLAPTTFGGCAVKHRAMRVANSVTVADLDQETEIARNLVLYFDSKPSTGRFPTALAVVRVAKVWDTQGSEFRLKIQPFLPYEAPFWTELFDGTPEIRSVFFLHQKSVRGDWITVSELLKAAATANAGLLLVYGYDNAATPSTCEVGGILYEVPSNERLAAISNGTTLEDAAAAAESLPLETKPVTPEDWDFYVDYVAFRGFEHKLRDGVWHLIDRDQASEVLEYNPYADPTLPGADRSRADIETD